MAHCITDMQVFWGDELTLDAMGYTGLKLWVTVNDSSESSMSFSCFKNKILNRNIHHPNCIDNK